MNIKKNKVLTASKEELNRQALAHLVGQIIDNRWMVVAVTVFFILITTFYIFFATPIYSADALVQIDRKNTSTILNDLQNFIPTTPASDTEIQILESRMVIGKTVQDLNLDAVVSQNYFPLIGRGLARLMGKRPSNITLAHLEIPKDIYNQSVELEITGKDSYTVSADGHDLFKGKVGQFKKHGGISMLISSINAGIGTTFTVTKLNELQAINAVLSNLTVADKGKDTGVIGLQYVGEEPEQICKILNQIVSNYLLQNVDRKSEQVEKSLEFLRQKLPEVNSKLAEAEDKLNTFRRNNESVDLSLEAKSALDSSVNVQSQLNQLTFREAEVSKLFTRDHPTYHALLEKRKTLEKVQNELNKKITQMPKTQQEILRLTRDVQSGQDIYIQLLNRQQELSISKASTVGDVRIIDSAATENIPVSPKKLLIIAASLTVSQLVSLGFILVKEILYKGIENPEQLEELGINVYASIPFSEWQRQQTKAIARWTYPYKGKNDPHDTLLALGNPADLSIEALRSLRTSLHFAVMEAKNNILMITGISPGIGKTFICVNLATLFAKAGKNVLFIDADMRRGYTHDILGADNKLGLSDLLLGKIEFSSTLMQKGAYGFDFLPRGQVPPNPAELLMHNRINELLEWASKNYELVLIDTPPILAVTDASIIGKLPGTLLMVVRFKTNTVKEVDVSFKRFAQNGIEIKGVILNAVVRKATNLYGYGYDYYGYDYYNYSKTSKN